MSNAANEDLVRRRMLSCDYEAVFAQGGCFHFALRLMERGRVDRVRGIRSNCGSVVPKHVWGVIKIGGQDKGIDIRGIYREEILVEMACGIQGGAPGTNVGDVTKAELREFIKMKGWSDGLTKELNDLADKIVDSHKRFEEAKPLDPKENAEFQRCLNERATSG